MPNTAKALFLDRDGTLIRHIPYLHEPALVALLPGVREALLAAQGRGYRLFLFTNQSGIGRGLFTLTDAVACNDRMIELLELSDGGFTQVCIAPEHPDLPIIYRKPSPRFIQEMILLYSLDPSATWMIGDKPTDIEAGIAAGVRTALVYNLEDDVPREALRFLNLPDFIEHLDT